MIPVCVFVHFAADLAALGGIDVANVPPQPAPAVATASTSAPRPLLTAADAPALTQELNHGGYDGWQFELGAGFTSTASEDGPDEEIDFDEGAGFMLGLLHRSGSDDGDKWAFDFGVETVWTDQDADNEEASPIRDITVLAVLLSGVVDFSLSEAWSIYGGVGVGGAWTDVGTADDELSNFEEEDGPFLAWQAKAGVRWYTSEDISWNLGYRFLNVDDSEIDDNSAEDLDFELGQQQHIAEIGVRFHL